EPQPSQGPPARARTRRRALHRARSPRIAVRAPRALGRGERMTDRALGASRVARSAHARRDPVCEGEGVAGKYEVCNVIGRGGRGVVVAARHLTLGSKVALKFLRPEAAFDPDIAERFVREGRAAARLRSEHVARVLDASSTDDGVSFLVMELLEGRDF